MSTFEQGISTLVEFVSASQMDVGEHYVEGLVDWWNMPARPLILLRTPWSRDRWNIEHDFGD